MLAEFDIKDPKSSLESYLSDVRGNPTEIKKQEEGQDKPQPKIKQEPGDKD